MKRMFLLSSDWLGLLLMLAVIGVGVLLAAVFLRGYKPLCEHGLAWEEDCDECERYGER